MEFTKSITTEKIVSLMSKIFVTHGLPCSLRTDKGPQFISDHFKGYLEKKKKAQSSDAIGGRDLAANLESQVLKVGTDTSNRPS